MGVGGVGVGALQEQREGWSRFFGLVRLDGIGLLTFVFQRLWLA